MIEWTEQQQIRLLLQCGGLGFLLGVLYDIFSIVGMRGRRARVAVFAADALFGVTAALITFFAALAIMDGKLHPMLFIGSAVGFTVQHVSLGRVATRWMIACGRAFLRAIRWVMRLIFAPFQLLWRLLRGIITHILLHRAKKIEKKRKIFPFFQKNS